MRIILSIQNYLTEQLGNNWPILFSNVHYRRLLVSPKRIGNLLLMLAGWLQ